MSTDARAVFTLSSRLLHEIDRFESDRARFVRRAVRREVRRRRRDELRRSLAHPHPETAATAEAGFDAWAQGLPDEDALALVNLDQGQPVRWSSGLGWTRTTD